MSLRSVDMKHVCQTLRGVKTDDEWLEVVMFGPKKATTAEFAAERAKLVTRLRELGMSFESDPTTLYKFWSFLCQERRGYDPKHDGPSEAMSLVDDVEALRAVEKEPCN